MSHQPVNDCCRRHFIACWPWRLRRPSSDPNVVSADFRATRDGIYDIVMLMQDTTLGWTTGVALGSKKEPCHSVGWYARSPSVSGPAGPAVGTSRVGSLPYILARLEGLSHVALIASYGINLRSLL